MDILGDDDRVPPPRPAPDPRDVSVCIICGGTAFARKCKIVCRNCGYTRDCSDP